MLDGFHAFPKRAPHRQCILLALSLALYLASAWPQTQLATVFGTITDSTGAVITEAQVTVSAINTGLRRVGLTDINGEYHMAGLPSGMYTVRAEKEKFQMRVLEGVALSSGAAIAINLSLGVGAVPQNVTVNANVAIDTTTSTVSEVIAERSLTELPLDGRDLFKSTILQPGVAPTPSSAPSLL
jgi:Carboxypeptidase regulatory-like domain